MKPPTRKSAHILPIFAEESLQWEKMGVCGPHWFQHNFLLFSLGILGVGLFLPSASPNEGEQQCQV